MGRFGAVLILILAVLSLMPRLEPVERSKEAPASSTGQMTPTRDDRAQLAAQAELSERAFQQTDDGFAAVNAGQAMLSLLSERGVSVAPDDPTPSWHWKMMLVGYGTGDVVLPVAPAETVVDGTRLIYRRGSLDEWYVNERRGLEQGFTLHDLPDGAETATTVRLALAIDTQLTLGVQLDDTGVDWMDSSGAVAVSYAGLVAWDADDRLIPARLSTSPGQLWLDIDVADARFPVTVDPWIQRHKLLAADGQADDFFGWSVAVSGDDAIIGAPGVDGGGFNRGAAYIFVRNPSTGAWTQRQKLFPIDSATKLTFGHRVAIDGDKALVSSGGPTSSEGFAHVFVRDATTQAWAERQTITIGDGTMYGGAINSLAVDQNVAVIGTNSASSSNGAAHIYSRNQSTGNWLFQQKLTANDPAVGDFGYSVDIEGRPALIGAIGSDSKGAAYIFIHDQNTGNWIQQQKLTAFDGASGDSFGYHVALAGDTAMISAYYDDNSRGSAYIFSRNSSGGWSYSQKLVASDSSSNDRVGVCIALDRDTALIGAIGDDGGMGAVYAFTRDASTGRWGQRQRITAIGSVSNSAAGFGGGLALSGDTALIGTTGDDHYAANAGAVYVFTLGLAPARPGADVDRDGRADIGVWSPASGLWFALRSGGGDPFVNYAGGPRQVPVPGDYNGDGIMDAGVFEPNGAVWYIKITGGGIINTTLGAYGVNQVPVPADYDGDGKADLAVWVPSYGLYLVQRSTGGWLSDIIGSPQAIPVPADYDGDGRADIAVWEPTNGLWFALPSGGGDPFVNFAGSAGHIPVPADYNGDGRADAGIFAPNGAVWYIRLTGGGTINVSLGASGTNQVPIPGDYDGDRKADLGVWVPENSFWLVQKSTGGWLYNRIGDRASLPIQKRPGYPSTYPYDPGVGNPTGSTR